MLDGAFNHINMHAWSFPIGQSDCPLERDIDSYVKPLFIAFFAKLMAAVAVGKLVTIAQARETHVISRRFLSNSIEAVTKSRRRTNYTSTNRITSARQVGGQIVHLKIFRFHKSTQPEMWFLIASLANLTSNCCRFGWIKQLKFL